MDDVSYFCAVDQHDRCVSQICQCGCHEDEAWDIYDQWDGWSA